jgi:molybdopterin molybdotransferase
VKPALALLGVTPQLWRVKIKPGKPFLFAQQGGCSIFGLPGNPVSSFVTYHLFVRPALLKLMGAAKTEPRSIAVKVAHAVKNPGDRPHYLRGIVDEAQGFHSTGLQTSHALFGLSQANALLRLEPGQELSTGAAAVATLI